MTNYNENIKISTIFILFTLPFTLSLQVGFYSSTCPTAEIIVQQTVQQRFNTDKSVTAALLRMHFHDCFVRGCDGSILLDSPNSNTEKFSGPNLTVREFELIDQIKTRLEAACPRHVSCADIIALATRDAVALAGGPSYAVPTGRRDGTISRIGEVNLPGPTFSVAQAQQAFQAKGMNLTDMITLLGAHTVGVAHCSFFDDRIFSNPDPTMDPALVTKLRGICSSTTDPDPAAFLDQNTSFVFDNSFYNQIGSKKGVLKIDQNLANDPLSSSLVSSFAANNVLFSQRFVNAMIKMGNIQVLQGTAGQIRRNCRVINNQLSGTTNPFPLSRDS